MLKLLEGFRETVIAVIASKRITRRDYEDILIPKIEEAFHKR